MKSLQMILKSRKTLRDAIAGLRDPDAEIDNRRFVHKEILHRRL